MTTGSRAKPEALLERVILASSDEAGVVLDPFCGCGTAVAVAQKLGRRWIGIDITHLAIGLVKHRLYSSFGKDLSFEVIGEPRTIEDAHELALENRYQFEWWALGLVGARPTEKKQGPDQGIDGRLFFHDEPSRTSRTKQILFSVKSGKVTPVAVRELRGVIAREEAELGALLTLQPPTRDMIAEAAAAGFYTSPWGHHPRIQILTIEQLLQGARLDYPAASTSNVTLRRAPAVTPKGETLPLPFGPSSAPVPADRPGLAATRGERPRGLIKAEARGVDEAVKRRRGGS